MIGFNEASTKFLAFKVHSATQVGPNVLLLTGVTDLGIWSNVFIVGRYGVLGVSSLLNYVQFCEDKSLTSVSGPSWPPKDFVKA